MWPIKRYASDERSSWATRFAAWGLGWGPWAVSSQRLRLSMIPYQRMGTGRRCVRCQRGGRRRTR